MNITDIVNIDEVLKKYPKDSLNAIFTRQKELMAKYRSIEMETLPCLVPSDIPVSLNSYEGQHQVKARIMWAETELVEAADCLKNKPWKQTMIEVDVDHFHEELADALHFFVEACIMSGIDWIDLLRLYFRKAEVNKFRQDSNY